MYWNAEKGCWQTAIHRQGKTHFLRYFPTEEEAALAYNQEAAATDGEFARLNQVKPERTLLTNLA